MVAGPKNRASRTPAQTEYRDHRTPEKSPQCDYRRSRDDKHEATQKQKNAPDKTRNFKKNEGYTVGQDQEHKDGPPRLTCRMDGKTQLHIGQKNLTLNR
ncbi:MAG: hypothetical protein CMO40_06010 [Verrucomicrobiaceae bacterium]|nr:hypothetical protein [Verrucomicrobiaceae bacterium]